MDRYPTFEKDAPPAALPARGAASGNDVGSYPLNKLPSVAPRSMADMAQQDLHAALQLLAERAQFVTGASGAMIGLLENGRMICRASAGAAVQSGHSIQAEAGLTKESMEQKQLLRCDDTELDPRVNREACRELKIRSVMVSPLLHDGTAVGMFELLGEQPCAFEENDASSLEWLAECAATALEHADANRRVLNGELPVKTTQPTAVQTSSVVAAPASNNPSVIPPPKENPSPVVPAATKAAITKQCARCGFPISLERLLCVDCEAIEEHSSSPADMARGPLSQFAIPTREEGWFERNMYTIGTIALAALTALAAWLKFH